MVDSETKKGEERRRKLGKGSKLTIRNNQRTEIEVYAMQL
jgi:hypothetical protein